MPSGTYKQVDVLCPFFKYDDNQRITCEGIIPHSNIRHIFHSPAAYNKHMTEFCCNRYRDCEIAKLVDEKYDDQGRRRDNE